MIETVELFYEPQGITVHLIIDYDNGMCYDYVAKCSIFFKD